MSKRVVLVIEICNYTHFNGTNLTTGIVCVITYFFTTLFNSSFDDDFLSPPILFAHLLCVICYFQIIKRKTQSHRSGIREQRGNMHLHITIKKYISWFLLLQFEPHHTMRTIAQLMIGVSVDRSVFESAQ